MKNGVLRRRFCDWCEDNGSIVGWTSTEKVQTTPNGLKPAIVLLQDLPHG